MRIAVLGVGLIGGSIGLAARRRLGAEVVGFDPTAEPLERALELGAIDEAAGGVAEAVAGAEAIFCAAPVGGAAGARRARRSPPPAPDAVVTDVGSTKRALLAAVAGIEGHERFVGGHPLAGAETAGRRELARGPLRGRALVPDPDASAPRGCSTTACSGLLAGIGARPQAIDADHPRPR